MAAEAIEKINTIAEEACQRIEKIIPMLQTSVDHFTDATFKNLFWYENAELFYKLSFSVLATRSNAYQLLALEPNELVEVLDWDHVGSDMERYLAYVRRIIPEATRREMTSDEVLEARLDPPVHPTDNEAFIENAFQLIQVLVDCSRDKDALHVLVLLKSSIRVSYARMQDGRLAEHHALLNSAIRAFVAKCPLDEGAESKLYIRENFVDIMVNGLTWRQQSDSGRRHTWYWDFAAAKRHLNGAYFDTWCYDRVPEDRILHNNVEYDSRSDCCFHSASLGLLDWLQTKAWLKAPNELTERIFEYALEAEGIDADPRLIYYESAKPSEFAKLKCDHLHYIEPNKHLRKVRGADYCCRVIDHHIMKGDRCVDLEDFSRDIYMRIWKILERKKAFRNE